MSLHPSWSYLAQPTFQHKTFIKASGSLNTSSPSVSNAEPEVVYQGSEARQVYEEIIQEDDEIVYCGKVDPKPEPKKTLRVRKQERQFILALFKAIETSNVSHATQLLEEGGDINARDDFHWTPLMSAACIGCRPLVSLLLRHGAKRSCKEKTGKTASDLARTKGHAQIADFIENWEPLREMAPIITTSTEESTSVTNKSFFCDTCQQNFQEMDGTRHLSSVVHQFNVKAEPVRTYYGIVDSNRGFQMLLKSGWNREKGLGPEGTGLKFPAKTVLKRDRSGLGVERAKGRVTHFAPYDTSAVEGRKAANREQVPPAANNEAHRYRERWKEIALRRELS